jgi:hypothetical protein
VPRLDLTAEEAEELRALLRDCLSDLRMEIADTESADFREGLKRRELFLDKLIAQLGDRA